jgi:hypothetical protein
MMGALDDRPRSPASWRLLVLGPVPDVEDRHPRDDALRGRLNARLVDTGEQAVRPEAGRTDGHEEGPPDDHMAVSDLARSPTDLHPLCKRDAARSAAVHRRLRCPARPLCDQGAIRRVDRVAGHWERDLHRRREYARQPLEERA